MFQIKIMYEFIIKRTRSTEHRDLLLRVWEGAEFDSQPGNRTF
jgi:hypothetical protein